MYSTKNAFKQKEERVVVNIYDYLDPYAIFAKYIGAFIIGRAYNSPLREDKSASFAVFIDKKTSMLLYKDLATGDCGDAIKFVKVLFNLNSAKEAILLIKKDFLLESNPIKLETKKEYSYSRVKISISRRLFNEQDLKYWSNFGIKRETLSKFNVIPIKSYASDDIVKYIRTGNELAYAYKVFSNFKIYRPLSSKQDKWRGNLSSLDMFGYEQLPKSGQILFVTKSLKDVMVLHELGYPAIAPPSESSAVNDLVIKDLNNRFNKIIIFYDRDAAGLRYARKLFQKTRWDFFFIPKHFNLKDLSDFAGEKGLTEAGALIDSVVDKKKGMKN